MRQVRASIILLTGLLLITGAPLRAQMLSLPPEKASNPGGTPTERWVWGEARGGRVADLHARCGARLDPHNADDIGWDDKCRRVTAGFIVRVLIRKTWQDALPRQG